MPVVPNPSFFRNLAYYIGLGKIFIITWLICKVVTFFLVIAFLILAVKYSAYLPDNPNYRRNYDDTKVLPRNPFTEAPATMKQSEIDALKKH
jgi:hypothetical protein